MHFIRTKEIVPIDIPLTVQFWTSLKSDVFFFFKCVYIFKEKERKEGREGGRKKGNKEKRKKKIRPLRNRSFTRKQNPVCLSPLINLTWAITSLDTATSAFYVSTHSKWQFFAS